MVRILVSAGVLVSTLSLALVPPLLEGEQPVLDAPDDPAPALTVLDERGVPVFGARVLVVDGDGWRAEGRTGRMGTWRQPLPTSGTVVVRRSGYVPVARPLPLAERTLVLTGARYLRGRVLDLPSGRPGALQVVAWPDRASTDAACRRALDGHPLGHRAAVDSCGRFLLYTLAPGETWSLGLLVEGRLEPLATGVEAGRVDLELRLGEVPSGR